MFKYYYRQLNFKDFLSQDVKIACFIELFYHKKI